MRKNTTGIWFGTIILFSMITRCSQLPSAENSTTSRETEKTAAETSTPIREEKPELGRFFQGNAGAFVLFDGSENQYIQIDPERCAERFLPASTFKIMNALIGLETGVIPDEDYVIQWDGTQYGIPSWNQNHSLKTAMQNSVVWYFQELARRVGGERMADYVNLAEYGNKDISGQIDAFWLEGGLRISADEQVEFLKRLYFEDLPFSGRTMEIVKDILVLETDPRFTLSGKTGSAQRTTPHIGWFVGYVEANHNEYFFATNFESSDPNGMANGESAKKMTWNILDYLGVF
ncbi:MAG: class D beta-lactamase [Anaerolineales bacterium]|nr:class D beta-lactamase [Anaerolineales bacterium]